MNQAKNRTPLRAMVLITTPKLSERAAKLFQQGHVPVQYQWNASGTASSEMMDILGLGSPDKRILISVLPKSFANDLLKKLRKGLKLGSVNSGIAFTLPLSGASNWILRLLDRFNSGENESTDRKDKSDMADAKYSLIAAILNQGYSEDAMEVAREAGAGGGTVVHSRQIGSKETMSIPGISIHDEKEIIFIVAENDCKLKIMQAIGEKCGIRSEAQGIVLSLPIDTVIGPEDFQ